MADIDKKALIDEGCNLLNEAINTSPFWTTSTNKTKQN